MKSRRRRTTATRTIEDLGADEFAQGQISGSPASEAFEFSSRKSKTVFEQLVKAFIDDYMKRRHSPDDSGWRGLGQLAKEMKTPPSSMYGRHGGMSPELGELVRKGLVETRVFRGERGRGGEATRLRIAYDRDPVKEYVKGKIAGTSEEGTARRMFLPRNRLAVLPFVNMSPDPDDEYFAAGLTEELIGTVSKIRELRVISHTSVMRYKDRSRPILEIGRELNTGTFIEGSVRKTGNRVRIGVQMIDANKDEHLWAENYDRTLADVFAIQSEIASKVSEELKIQLAAFDKGMLEKRPTRNTHAYTSFLQARELLRKGDGKSLESAVAQFQKAIELDSSFARAHCDLADCYLRLGNAGYEPYHESIAKAKVPLKRALDLDPNLPDAHAILSLLLFNEDDVRGAEVEARRAIELNPSLPEAYRDLSNVLVVKGVRFREIPKEHRNKIVRLVETCYRLDPLHPRYIVDLGTAYFYSGREREALDHWNRTAELAPAGSYRIMTEYYLWKGDYERAKELHSSASELDPTHAWVKIMKGIIEALVGDREAALAEIRRIRESERDETVLTGVGFIYHALGDFDSYFDCVEKGLDLHVADVTHMLYCPLFAKARAFPRYRALQINASKMLWPDEK